MILQHYPRKFWTFVSGFYDFLPAVHFDVFFFVILRCSVVQNVCKDQRKFYGKKNVLKAKVIFLIGSPGEPQGLLRVDPPT